MLKRYFKKLCKRLAEDESGPTSVEYAVILALIVAVCISSVNFLADSTRKNFDNSAKAINDAIGG